VVGIVAVALVFILACKFGFRPVGAVFAVRVCVLAEIELVAQHAEGVARAIMRGEGVVPVAIGIVSWLERVVPEFDRWCGVAGFGGFLRVP
jgi:hypothetical protein